MCVWLRMLFTDPYSRVPNNRKKCLKVQYFSEMKTHSKKVQLDSFRDLIRDLRLFMRDFGCRWKTYKKSNNFLPLSNSHSAHFSSPAGLECDRCVPSFYGFPDCKQCNCNPAGTLVRGGAGSSLDCSSSNDVSKCFYSHSTGFNSHFTLIKRRKFTFGKNCMFKHVNRYQIIQNKHFEK